MSHSKKDSTRQDPSRQRPYGRGKERRKRKREKRKGILVIRVGGMACWAWISNSVFRAAVIAQNSGRMAREETVSAKSVTALETKTGM